MLLDCILNRLMFENAKLKITFFCNRYYNPETTACTLPGPYNFCQVNYNFSCTVSYFVEHEFIRTMELSTLQHHRLALLLPGLRLPLLPAQLQPPRQRQEQQRLLRRQQLQQQLRGICK